MNQNFSDSSHIINSLLSRLGKRIFFPSGIVAQAEQSSKATIQATAGMAFEHNELAYLPEIKDAISEFTANDAVRYAQVAGIPTLRTAWQDRMLSINPSLNKEYISTPIVSGGLTHGVNTILQLTLDPEDVLISPDCFWENYQHIAETVIGTSLSTFPMFDEAQKFNVDGLSKILDSHLQQKKKAIILLNFPNNPTGYSICKDDAQFLFDTLYKFADRGLPILTITDDAYFGLFYKEEVYTQSLFAKLSQLHEKIFAVKIDGITKELLSWGLRVGFLTFGNKNMPKEVCASFEKKIIAYIRSTITSASRLSQSIALRALQTKSLEASIQAHKHTLMARFSALTQALATAQEQYPQASIKPIPCNSGYFISFACKSAEYSQKLRTTILSKEHIALISIDDKLRFAFSCVEESDIDTIIQIIYQYASAI